MEALIRDWRRRWHRSTDFSFSMVQLCPAGDNSNGALRMYASPLAVARAPVVLAVASR
jgi:hypothetical protein